MADSSSKSGFLHRSKSKRNGNDTVCRLVVVCRVAKNKSMFVAAPPQTKKVFMGQQSNFNILRYRGTHADQALTLHTYVSV